MHSHGGSSLEDPWQYESESLSAQTEGLVSSRRPDVTSMQPNGGFILEVASGVHFNSD
jgi:hypothetical protein